MVSTKIVRIDEEFEKVLDRLRSERLLKGVDKRIESPRRISKAIARLIDRDMILRDILIHSPLDNDRNQRGRKIKFK